MTLQHAKIALATAWVGAAVVVLVGVGQVASSTSLIAVAIVGTLPPLALWFWWNEPAQTMSESIHAVREEAGSGRIETPYTGASPKKD